MIPSRAHRRQLERRQRHTGVVQRLRRRQPTDEVLPPRPGRRRRLYRRDRLPRPASGLPVAVVAPADNAAALEDRTRLLALAITACDSRPAPDAPAAAPVIHSESSLGSSYCPSNLTCTASPWMNASPDGTKS